MNNKNQPLLKSGMTENTEIASLNLDYEDLLINYTEESYIIVGTDLKIINFSLGFQKMYYQYFNKVVCKGDSILNYTTKEREAIVRNLYERALNGEIVENETSLPIKDTTTLNILNKYKPIYNQEKQVTGIFVSAFNITSFKKTELITQKQEDKYRLIIENSLDAFLIGTQEGFTLTANDAAVEMFGYSKEEFTKLHRKDFVDHADEQFLGHLKERQKTGRMRGEGIGIRKNGERFPFEISSIAFKDVDDKIRVANFLRDISVRKKAEKSVELSEKRFRALVENATDVLVLTNQTGSILYVSPAFEKVTGFTLSEIQKDHQLLSKSLHADYYPIAKDTFIKAIENPGVPVARLLKLKHKDGYYVWLEGVITNMLHDENVGAMVSNYRDISERKEAESRVIKSENRFRALVEKSEDLLVLTNASGIISYVSPAFEKLTGYSQPEIVGSRNLIVMHEEQANETHTIFSKLLENPGLSIPRLNRLKCKDGTYRWVEGYITNLLNDENVEAIVSNYHDITERLQAEEVIRDSENNLKTIFENTSEAFLLIDRQGKIKAFNSNTKQFAFLNTTNEIEIGKDALDFVEDDRKEIIRALFEKVYAGENIQFDRLYEKESGEIWLNFSITPVEEDGRIAGICVTGRDITARKQAEEALKKRELRFRSILENSHDMLFLFDAEGRIEFLSPVIERVFGYKNLADEIYNILDRIHPDDLEKVLKYLQQAFSRPEVPVFVTFRKSKKNGIYLWLEGTLTNMLHMPEVNAIVANVRDITERKVFEEEQEFLVSIINTSEDAIMSIDTNKTILSWNHGAEKMFGYTDTEVIGKSIFQITPPNRYHEEDEIFSKIQKREIVNHYETQRLTKTGTLVDISLTVSPIKDNKGNIIGISKIARNITDKKKAEQIISNNEKRFRSLLQNSNDGLSLLNIAGETLEISQSGKKILGFDDSEMIGNARYDLVHPDDLENVSQAFIDVINDPEKTRFFEYRSLCKHGNYKWLEASCLNLLNEPAVGAIVVNFRDITERKNQEIEREKMIMTLNQNNKDLRNFSFITSHNLRAPLSNLVGLIHVLDDITIEDDALKAIIGGFRASTIQLDTTINDLIKILVIRDNDSVERKEISFSHLFTQVENQLGILIDEAQPEIELSFEKAPEVIFNESYLESIFINLLTNAIKFRSYDRKLKVSIKSKKADNIIELTFADNGIGIDLNRHKAKVFGLYQRFHERPNSKGLGLYLIKSQMESLGGSITVESTVDVGTTFILRFEVLPRLATDR